jgi:uncharacterized protein YndB with AHSA1/START domain
MIQRINELLVLPAEDVTRAKRFYREVLGLRTLLDEDGFAIFDTGRLQLGVHARGTSMPEPDLEGIWIWLEVDDLDVARASLEAKGVRFVGTRSFLGPGWEQPFLDSEGNVLRLYQPLREVRRSVLIRAPAPMVFAALTDARAVEEWFGGIDDVVLEPRTGGRVAFVDPLFGRVEGTVREFVPHRRIAIVFKANWPRILEFDLVPESDGTRVEVRQAGFEQIRDRDYLIHLEVAKLEAAMDRLQERAEIGQG